MAQRDWDEHYTSNVLPWDTGEPDGHLVAVVRSRPVLPGRALEVGCGTGTNALWLARQGFNVFGVDLAPTAVERARAKQRPEDGACRFAVVNFLENDLAAGPFDFVFDRGCFHVFDSDSERDLFAARVVRYLAPGGLWLSVIGSTEGPPRDSGPPRRSARDIVNALEPYLELVELRQVGFQLPDSAKPMAWLCLSRARRLPAQPSTRRE